MVYGYNANSGGMVATQETVYCPYCGGQNWITENYCYYCGLNSHMLFHQQLISWDKHMTRES
ncbi:MAG: hypothetical protein DRO11_05295 [Methanobacteriota archaeon]|nr:MAG: hypothetical protein DRO11_05295 [Euryarchaeota archaeon]